MKSTLKFLAALFLCAQTILFSSVAHAQNQDGFVDMIDGVSLNGWNIVGNASWVIGNGIVEGNKPSGFLVSTKSYKNFVIKAEFWAESNTNSGIFIRCQDPNKSRQTTLMKSISGTLAQSKLMLPAQLWMSQKWIRFIKLVDVGTRWRSLPMDHISK